MSTPSLILNDVSCIRGGRMLFAGLSLTLMAGEGALLRGANGIGKSSLIRIAAGLLPPFSGMVDRSGATALSDEALALDIEQPLERALSFWARLDGGDARAGMAAMELTHLADIPVRMLSTGQRKRAMLARVIASGAPIWLLDEPANGLDGASLALLGASLGAHRGKGGIVLAASHQPLPSTDMREIDLAAFAVQAA